MTPEQAKKQAIDYTQSGYNCAESVLHTICDAHGYDFKDYVPLLSGFGSGIGGAASICGALVAAIAGIGLKAGRTAPDQDKKRVYSMSKIMHDSFMATFGSTSCQELRANCRDEQEQKLYCNDLSGSVTAMTIELLSHNKIFEPR